MRNLGEIYDMQFYRNQADGSLRSARVIVPYVLNIVLRTNSVIDVGCGTGAWLSEFLLHGVTEVFGIDGGNAGDLLLQIDSDRIRRQDLETPIAMDRRFDLCMSLEVAEHLSPERSETFIHELCVLADVVLFGAAIPGQGGCNHINERWPSYWISLFRAQGYECFDVIRPTFWHDRRVEWWYSQNTFLFVRAGVPKSDDLGMQVDRRSLTNVVHPRCFDQYYRENAALRAASSASAEGGSRPGQSCGSDLGELVKRVNALTSSTPWRILSPLRRLKMAIMGFTISKGK